MASSSTINSSSDPSSESSSDPSSDSSSDSSSDPSSDSSSDSSSDPSSDSSSDPSSDPSSDSSSDSSSEPSVSIRSHILQTLLTNLVHSSSERHPSPSLSSLLKILSARPSRSRSPHIASKSSWEKQSASLAKFSNMKLNVCSASGQVSASLGSQPRFKKSSIIFPHILPKLGLPPPPRRDSAWQVKPKSKMARNNNFIFNPFVVFLCQRF